MKLNCIKCEHWLRPSGNVNPPDKYECIKWSNSGGHGMAGNAQLRKAELVNYDFTLSGAKVYTGMYSSCNEGSPLKH